MASDIEKERLIPLRLASKYFPRSSRTGRDLNISVLYRYIHNGLLAADGGRVYLRARKAGSCICVTRRDIGAFLSATGADENLPDKNTTRSRARVANRRQRCTARDVEKALDQAGF